MSIPTGEKPDEREKRAAFISDLRALADMLENEPKLPIPYDMEGTAYLSGNTPEKLATLFALAELLGTEVTYRPSDGVCETSYKRGLVEYDLYVSVGKPPARPDGKLVVTSPAQVLTTATIEPPVNGEQFPVDQVRPDVEPHPRTGGPS